MKASETKVPTNGVEVLFSQIRCGTPCPYARHARNVYAAQWNEDVGWDENIILIANLLGDVSALPEFRKIHGFTCSLLVERCDEFPKVRAAFASFMDELSKCDPWQSYCMQSDLMARGWQYQYAGIRHFVSVFAPCYSADHPRHSPVPRFMFVYFQPEWSFDICGINQGTVEEKQIVRSLFQRSGKQYNGELIDGRIEALLYLLPLERDGAPVRWWETM